MDRRRDYEEGDVLERMRCPFKWDGVVGEGKEGGELAGAGIVQFELSTGSEGAGLGPRAEPWAIVQHRPGPWPPSY